MRLYKAEKRLERRKAHKMISSVLGVRFPIIFERSFIGTRHEVLKRGNKTLVLRRTKSLRTARLPRSGDRDYATYFIQERVC